jgi:tRNA pseudouridine55 synthase
MKSRRPVNGVLVLDKPVGMSSNHCLQRVKHMLNAEKAGHTGSLDPLACGVLPLCFGEATKVAQYLLDSDKTYRTVAQLGIKTSSGDRDGDIVSTRPVPDCSEEDLQQVLQQFRGTITQQPSIYSALKQNGVPLYKLARAGQPIEPKFREIEIFSLELVRWQKPELELVVRCSKGSYIRTLAEDIGEALGCGAHVIHLQREQAGPFTLQHAVTLERLAALHADNDMRAIESLLIAPDKALDSMPALQFDSMQTQRLRQGQHVTGSFIPQSGTVRVYADEEFIGLAEVSNGTTVTAKRLMKY